MKPLLVLAVLLGTVRLSAQVEPLNAAGVAMGHLHILTPNPAAHKKIWVDVLGGKIVKAGPMEFVMFPGVLLAFRAGSAGGASVGSIVDHLGFLVSDLDATKNKVAAAAKIVSENPATRQFFALFPDDVTVEFSEDKTLTMPIRHHHIHFATPAEDEMRAWYAKVFGAKPGMRGRFKAADLPGVNLTWKPADAPTLPTKGRAMDHIGFEVKNIAALCAKAEAEGAKITTKPMSPQNLGLTVAFLTDPWGTTIELTEGLDKLN